ncbi:MAG: hypothetical protein KDD37_10070 [Bdellovibrionales bacterium]|nr:hypothetical protein [Bdellovibrionales bacterium]
MSYEFYKILHLVGIFMILTSLSALTLHVIGGGTKLNTPFRKGLMAIHGTGVLLAFVAGFGLLAKLGIKTMPVWVIIKLLILVYFAVATVFLYKMPQHAKGFWFKIIILASLAAYFAIYKPI